MFEDIYLQKIYSIRNKTLILGIEIFKNFNLWFESYEIYFWNINPPRIRWEEWYEGHFKVIMSEYVEDKRLCFTSTLHFS